METRLKEVLAIVNNKGGVGKTTTVQSLAAAMVREHPEWKVLVIDLDPQGNLSQLMGWKPEWDFRPTVTDAMSAEDGYLPVYYNKKGIYYVPSSPALQKIEPKLTAKLQPCLVLRKLIIGAAELHQDEGEEEVNIPHYFDYVLIDCPPALSLCTYNAMAVASGLLIPVQMEGLAVSGIGPIFVEWKKVKRELNPQLEIRGLLPAMIDKRPNIVQSFVDYLRSAYGDMVTHTTIPRSVKVNEAQTKKQDIYEHKQWSPVANAYERLCKELFG